MLQCNMVALTEMKLNDHIGRSGRDCAGDTVQMLAMMTRRSFHCYAYGRPGDVEAICVDLDIAVQGTSFTEVRRIMNHAIQTYVEDALAEPPEVAQALLSRKSPWHVRAKLAALTLWFRLRSRFDGHNKDDATDFEIPCHA